MSIPQLRGSTSPTASNQVTGNQSHNHFNRLPTEVVHRIFSKIDISDVMRCRGVDKRFNGAARTFINHIIPNTFTQLGLKEIEFLIFDFDDNFQGIQGNEIVKESVILYSKLIKAMRDFVSTYNKFNTDNQISNKSSLPAQYKEAREKSFTYKHIIESKVKEALDQEFETKVWEGEINVNRLATLLNIGFGSTEPIRQRLLHDAVQYGKGDACDLLLEKGAYFTVELHNLAKSSPSQEIRIISQTIKEEEGMTEELAQLVLTQDMQTIFFTNVIAEKDIGILEQLMNDYDIASTYGVNFIESLSSLDDNDGNRSIAETLIYCVKKYCSNGEVTNLFKKAPPWVKALVEPTLKKALDDRRLKAQMRI